MSVVRYSSRCVRQRDVMDRVVHSGADVVVKMVQGLRSSSHHLDDSTSMRSVDRMPACQVVRGMCGDQRVGMQARRVNRSALGDERMHPRDVGEAAVRMVQEVVLVDLLLQRERT